MKTRQALNSQRSTYRAMELKACATLPSFSRRLRRNGREEYVAATRPDSAQSRYSKTLLSSRISNVTKQRILPSCFEHAEGLYGLRKIEIKSSSKAFIFNEAIRLLECSSRIGSNCMFLKIIRVNIYDAIR